MRGVFVGILVGIIVGTFVGTLVGTTGIGFITYPAQSLDWNESHFCDSELDRLSEIAGTTLDEEERKQAYDEIQRILIERGPVIIPYFFAQFAALNENVENFELKPFAGRSDFRKVKITD